MIPFLTRHLFGLPRTVANCNRTRLKLRNLGRWLACIMGAGFLAACGWVIVQLAFAF